jgi:hypothetical protein
MTCRECGEQHWQKVEWTGWFNRSLAALIGIGTWKCGFCGRSAVTWRREDPDHWGETHHPRHVS